MVALEQQLVNLQVLLHWDEAWRMQEPAKRRRSLLDLAHPSDRLHRLETLAFWRLLQRATAYNGEMREEEEAAIWKDIAEHVIGKKEGCLGNWQCSQQCTIRPYLSWPQGIPLNDPVSFKRLGEPGKELRVLFVRSVLEHEGVLGSAGPNLYPLQDAIQDRK